jgi:isopentenyldiphosphate isomerase
MSNPNDENSTEPYPLPEEEVSKPRPDSSYEEADGYDIDGNFVAVVYRWQVARPEATGLYGQSSQVLLMRGSHYAVAVRSRNKKFWPGALDFTASGMSFKDEDVLTTVVREAKEELLVELDPERINHWMSWVPKDGYYSKGSVFTYIWDTPYVPCNTDDVEQIRWLSLAELKGLLNDDVKMKPDFRSFLKHIMFSK